MKAAGQALQEITLKTCAEVPRETAGMFPVMFEELDQSLAVSTEAQKERKRSAPVLSGSSPRPASTGHPRCRGVKF